MSGVLFTDGNVLLAGYQPNKKSIGGIGGKAEPGETAHETAMREFLEEVFGYTTISKDLLKDVQLSPQKILWSKEYVVFVYSFGDLELMLDIIKWHGIPSPFYDRIPFACGDLIFKRNVVPDAEISHLCVLPCENQNIAPELLGDISGL